MPHNASNVKSHIDLQDLLGGPATSPQGLRQIKCSIEARQLSMLEAEPRKVFGKQFQVFGSNFKSSGSNFKSSEAISSLKGSNFKSPSEQVKVLGAVKSSAEGNKSPFWGIQVLSRRQ